MLAAARLRINLSSGLLVDQDDRAGGAGARRLAELLVRPGAVLLGDVAFEDEHVRGDVDAIALGDAGAGVDAGEEGHAVAPFGLRCLERRASSSAAAGMTVASM